MTIQKKPLPDPLDIHRASPRKNRIHSVLTALPVLMLCAGLYIYFKGESVQKSGTPILTEADHRDVVFDGFSKVQYGSGKGKYYFWYQWEGQQKGARLHYPQRQLLDTQALQEGEPLSISVAPTVAGSRTLWLYAIQREGNELLPPLEQQ